MTYIYQNIWYICDCVLSPLLRPKPLSLSPCQLPLLAQWHQVNGHMVNQDVSHLDRLLHVLDLLKESSL